MYNKTFESLFVRQEAKKMFCIFYEKTKSRKDYYLKDQLLRATLSISNNIAEGYERETNAELIRFLYIARGSAGEVRSMLLICLELNIISNDNYKIYIESINKISSGIYSLIKKTKTLQS